MKGRGGAAVLMLTLLAVVAPDVLADSPTEVTTESAATIGVDGVQRAEILAGSYFFRPGRVIVRVGVPVELKVRREPGVAPHNIVVKAPEAGVDFKVELGTEPTAIAFTPTKAGVYPMYCDKRFLFFSSHRDRGMEGALDVRE